MLIAVDTNVPLDLAEGIEDVLDGLALIRQRIKNVRLIAPPTVNLELAYLSEFADEETVKANAQLALRSLASKWKLQPLNLVPVGHGIVSAIGSKIRANGLLPDEEEHDAMILVWCNANSPYNSAAPPGLCPNGCGLPGVKTPVYCLAVPSGLLNRTSIPAH